MNWIEFQDQRIFLMVSVLLVCFRKWVLLNLSGARGLGNRHVVVMTLKRLRRARNSRYTPKCENSTDDSPVLLWSFLVFFYFAAFSSFFFLIFNFLFCMWTRWLKQNNWMDSFAFTVKFHFPHFCKLFLPLQACDYPQTLELSYVWRMLRT